MRFWRLKTSLQTSKIFLYQSSCSKNRYSKLAKVGHLTMLTRFSILDTRIPDEDEKEGHLLGLVNMIRSLALFWI